MLNQGFQLVQKTAEHQTTMWNGNAAEKREIHSKMCLLFQKETASVSGNAMAVTAHPERRNAREAQVGIQNECQFEVERGWFTSGENSKVLMLPLPCQSFCFSKKYKAL